MYVSSQFSSALRITVPNDKANAINWSFSAEHVQFGVIYCVDNFFPNWKSGLKLTDKENVNLLQSRFICFAIAIVSVVCQISQEIWRTWFPKRNLHGPRCKMLQKCNTRTVNENLVSFTFVILGYGEVISCFLWCRNEYSRISFLTQVDLMFCI